MENVFLGVLFREYRILFWSTVVVDFICLTLQGEDCEAAVALRGFSYAGEFLSFNPKPYMKNEVCRIEMKLPRCVAIVILIM